MFRKGREATAYPRPLPLDADRRAVEAAQRDPLRFETLYRKYVAQVYSFALYETRAHHAAEDVTEQVFLQALRGLPRFDDRGLDEGSTFRAWLFQICRNVLANERRHVRRHPQAPVELALDVPAKDDPAATVAARDEAAGAWRVIERLPGDRRQALTLRFVDEMSAREIGEVMGRSEGAIRVLIHRALRSVADELGGERQWIGVPDEDAIQLDLYLDHVLAGTSAAATGPALSTANAGLADTVRLMASGANRFHPSFRFEERLAARLRDVASGLEASPPHRGVLVPFAAGASADTMRSRHLAGVVVGSVIASGVSIASLAGAAAVVVWRRAHWERSA